MILRARLCRSQLRNVTLSTMSRAGLRLCSGGESKDEERVRFREAQVAYCKRDALGKAELLGIRQLRRTTESRSKREGDFLSRRGPITPPLS